MGVTVVSGAPVQKPYSRKTSDCTATDQHIGKTSLQREHCDVYQNRHASRPALANQCSRPLKCPAIPQLYARCCHTFSQRALQSTQSEKKKKKRWSWVAAPPKTAGGYEPPAAQVCPALRKESRSRTRPQKRSPCSQRVRARPRRHRWRGHQHPLQAPPRNVRPPRCGWWVFGA